MLELVLGVLLVVAGAAAVAAIGSVVVGSRLLPVVGKGRWESNAFRLADALSMQVEIWDGGLVVVGEHGGRRVVIRRVAHRGAAMPVNIEIGQGPEGVLLSRHDGTRGSMRIGHKEFDRAFWVVGRRDIALAAFSDRVRRGLLTCLDDHEPQITDDGSLHLLASKTDEDSVKRAIELGVELVDDMRRGAAEPLMTLGDRARHDPIGRVREVALRELVASYRKDSRASLKAALNDEHTKVRLVAASSLGEVDVMAAEVRNGDNRSADVRYAVRALGQYARRTGELEAVQPAFRYGLRHGTTTVVREVAKHTRELKLEALRPHLRAAIERRSGVHKWAELTPSKQARRRPVIQALLEALAALGPLGSTQPTVVALLDVPDDAIRRAAIVCLSDAGDVSAVEALRGLAQSAGLLSALPNQCEQAILQIQSRVGEAARGGLTLADPRPEQGALQLADDERGRLAMADGDPLPPAD